MSYIEALVLGLIQGLTEFLPVSSSGHLAVGHLLFGNAQQDNIPFDILLHIATLIVIFHAFGRTFLRIFRHERPLLITLGIALVPTMFVGFFFRHQMESLSQSPLILAFCFSFTGILLLTLSLVNRKRPDSPDAVTSNQQPSAPGLRQVSLYSAIAVGLAQALAIAPGISRSGATIATGQLTGQSAETAVAFSFLLGAPAILGAMLVEIRPITQLFDQALGPTLVGFMAALISGALALGLLKWIARSGNLPRFAPYCFFMSALCVFLFAIK